MAIQTTSMMIRQINYLCDVSDISFLLMAPNLSCTHCSWLKFRICGKFLKVKFAQMLQPGDLVSLCTLPREATIIKARNNQNTRRDPSKIQTSSIFNNSGTILSGLSWWPDCTSNFYIHVFFYAKLKHFQTLIPFPTRNLTLFSFELMSD